MWASWWKRSKQRAGPIVGEIGNMNLELADISNDGMAPETKTERLLVDSQKSDELTVNWCLPLAWREHLYLLLGERVLRPQSLQFPGRCSSAGGVRSTYGC